jgi:hypothetical protein
MKLFTKDINNKLFKQYQAGNDLDNQMVVSKIFNPYGKGRWFLLNSDPQDPDYLWAIVQMGDIVEVGSVSRSELESLRVSPFRFPLERDLGFSEVNAGELLRGLEKGKFYKEGGTLYAAAGMQVGRYYKDKNGDSYRYIGENSQGQELFNDGEKVIVKSSSDFEEESKSKKLFGIFEEGGELNGTIAGDAAKYIAKELSYYVTSIDEQPYNGITIFYVKDKESVNKTIKALKDLYGIEARVGYINFTGSKSVEFYNDQIVDTNNKMAKGGETEPFSKTGKGEFISTEDRLNSCSQELFNKNYADCSREERDEAFDLFLKKYAISYSSRKKMVKGGDLYDDMDEDIKFANKKVMMVAKSLQGLGFNVLEVNEADYDTNANIVLSKQTSVDVGLDGEMSIVIEKQDGLFTFIDCNKSYATLLQKLKDIDPKYLAKRNGVDSIKLTLSKKDSYDYIYTQDGTKNSITFAFGKGAFQFDVKKISPELEKYQQDILDAFVIQGIKQHEYKGGFSEAIKHLDTKVVQEANNNLESGGQIDWGEDLGDGFSVGNDVYISDKNSRFYDRIGYVIGKLGQSLVIRVGDDEMDAVVKKSGVERLEAPEFAKGGMVTLYDDYDKSAGYIIEKGNKYWTGKNWSDVKAYAESYKTKKEAEEKLKSTKMADGGELDEEDSLDYNSISDLQSERNRLVRWSNQYGSKGADYKIKQLEERIEYLKSKDSKMADGGILKVSKGENDKYYWKFTFENGKEEKSFDGFNTSADAQRDFMHRSKYFKMADGGEMDSDDGKNESFEKKVKDAMKHPNKWYFIADYVGDKKVVLKMFVGVKEVDVQIFKIDGLHAKMPRNYSGRRDTLKMIMDNFEPKMAMGGDVKFADKVKAIKASLLKTKKVSKKVQKDYGKTYNAKEAELAAKRIAGSMRKKGIK